MNAKQLIEYARENYCAYGHKYERGVHESVVKMEKFIGAPAGLHECCKIELATELAIADFHQEDKFDGWELSLFIEDLHRVYGCDVALRAESIINRKYAHCIA